VRGGPRAFGLVVALLLASGILATAALGDSCAVAVRWNGTIYNDVPARFALPERGARLDEVTIPDCTKGGRCAPPEESIAAFELTGVPADVALVVPGY
jgi:hypothetical protein